MMCRIVVILLIFINVSVGTAQSPYRNYSSTDNIILGVTAIVGLTASQLEHHMTPLTPDQAAQLDRMNINRFDRCATYNLSERSARLSDYGMRTGVLLPLGLLADSKIRADYQKLGYLYIETMAITNVLTELTKVTVQRIRPWVYNEDVPLENKQGKEAKKSFFSGHTSATFAGAVLCAKVFSDYYPDSDWKSYVWIGSLTLSSAVAYWRVRAGRHFPSDVIVGALVGGAVAYFIPEWHKTKTAGFLSASPRQPSVIEVRFNFYLN